MPRRTVSKEVEKLVEQRRAEIQLFTGENVSFDRALKDILFGEEEDEPAFFRL